MSNVDDTYLFILPWSLHHPGGVNQVVANLIDRFQKRAEMDPALLVMDWKATTAEELRIDGRRTFQLRLRDPFGGNGGFLSLARFVIHLPSELRKLKRFVEKYRVKVVNPHYPNLATLNWIVLKKTLLPSLKIIVSLHGLDIRKSFDLVGVRKWAWTYMLRNVDKVVTCAEGLRNETLDHYKGSSLDITNVYNGVSVARMKGICSGVTNAPQIGKKYILNIGTFEHKKGHDVLLRAFARLVDAHPDFDLVIVGRNGPKSTETRQLVQQLNLQSRVHLFEDLPHPQTIALLSQASFFVLSSRNEAFAVVLLEAGALARAVVATDICGVAELIDDGRSGLLVQPDAPTELSEAMNRLILSPELSGELGRSLHTRVSENFTWDHAADRYLEIANSLSA